MKRAFLCFLGPFLLGTSVAPRAGLAQTTADTETAASQLSTDSQEDRLAKLEHEVADAKSSADNAWMLTSAALVLVPPLC
jgi:hypothetical protein